MSDLDKVDSILKTIKRDLYSNLAFTSKFIPDLFGLDEILIILNKQDYLIIRLNFPFRPLQSWPE